MSRLLKIDNEYRDWIEDVSRRFKQSQIKASFKVNDEMLRIYWGIGRDISLMRKDAEYGSAFYQTASQDLKETLPGVESLSPTNLKYMKYFYEMYPEIDIRPQLVDESAEGRNRPQAVDDLGTNVIFLVLWLLLPVSFLLGAAIVSETLPGQEI